MIYRVLAQINRKLAQIKWTIDRIVREELKKKTLLKWIMSYFLHNFFIFSLEVYHFGRNQYIKQIRRTSLDNLK